MLIRILLHSETKVGNSKNSGTYSFCICSIDEHIEIELKSIRLSLNKIN